MHSKRIPCFTPDPARSQASSLGIHKKNSAAWARWRSGGLKAAIPAHAARSAWRGNLLRSIGRKRAVNLDTMNVDLAGIRIPDSKLAREITELARDTESPLLFHRSSRVYYCGALAGKRRRLKFDPALLYAGAMLQDMGLTHQ